MNDTLQTALCWLGLAAGLGYAGLLIYLAIASIRHDRRADALRTARKTELTPLSELDLTNADFDAELLALIEGDQK